MGTHGYIKITANATDPQNRIDVTAGTEGGELTARGIAVNYAAGATTTIARTAFGYSAAVTLTLPTGSSAGSLNISVPAELNITNGSIAIGRFVWNLAAEGDYVFTANGLLETVHIVAPPAPPTFAIISGPYPASITKNTATIVWKTNMLSNSTVKYGLNTSYMETPISDPSFVINHSIVLTGLSPDTLYCYRVISVNLVGTQVESSDKTFRTMQTEVVNISAGGKKLYSPALVLPP